MIGLLAIVWPSLQKPLRRTSLNEAAQQLRDAIDQSRYQAITSGAPVFVQFRQGEGEVRSGTFSSFMSDPAASTGDQPGIEDSEKDIAALSTPEPSMANKIEKTLPLKTWKLPDHIVVSEVTWSLPTPVDEELESNETDFEKELQGEMRESQGETLSQAEPNDWEASLTEGVEASRDWWLPVAASGQSRDASIVLLDTSLNETLTVTYEAASGSLEIVR